MIHVHTVALMVLFFTYLEYNDKKAEFKRNYFIHKNNSHPVGHDKVDRCTLLGAVCEAAEGAPSILLRRKFHAVHQDTVLT
jgi:hypothetical protein